MASGKPILIGRWHQAGLCLHRLVQITLEQIIANRFFR